MDRLSIQLYEQALNEGDRIMKPTTPLDSSAIFASIAIIVLTLTAASATSSSISDTFDGGDVTVPYDPQEPPEVTLPAGCVVFHASVDLWGGPAFVGQYDQLNFNDTGVKGWYGVSSENTPVSRPSDFEMNALGAHDRGLLDSEDDAYFRCLADGVNGDGAYQHFTFPIGTDPSFINNIHVHWRGRGEEPLVDMHERFKSDIYIWNDRDDQWEHLMGYGLCALQNLQTLKEDITGDFDQYVDQNEELHLLARSWVFGTMEAYLDTDYVEVNVSMEGGSQYATDPVLRLSPGGEPVWSSSGDFTGKVTLGDAVLKAPIQTLSDAAINDGAGDFQVRFLLECQGRGSLEFSNLSIEYGLYPEATSAFIEVSLDEDAEDPVVIDLLDHFQDDGPDGEMIFEITYEQFADRVDGYLEANGHSMGFQVMAEDWYGEADFGVRVTDADGLSVEFTNITVSVLPINDDPVALGIPDVSWWEDRDAPAHFIDLRDHFEDGGWMEDGVENLTYSLPGGLNPKLTDNTAVGLIADNRYFTCSPAPDFNGPVEFTVEVQDSDGGVVHDRFKVMFREVNDHPEFTSTPPSTVKENDNVSYVITTEDVDGDEVELTLERGPVNMTLSDDTLGWSPGDLDVGGHNISLYAWDGQNRTYQNFTLTVYNVNDPPEIYEQVIPDAVVGEEFAWKFRVGDVDLPFDPAEGLTFMDDSELFDVDFEDGSFTLVPHWTQVGLHRFNVTVTDRLGLRNVREFEVSIFYPEGMEAPGIDIVLPENGTEAVVGERTAVKAQFSGYNDGDWSVSWYVDGKADGNGLSVNITFEGEGPHTFTVVASDGRGQVEDSIMVIGTVEEDAEDSPGFGLLLLAFVVVVVVVGARKYKVDG